MATIVTERLRAWDLGLALQGGHKGSHPLLDGLRAVSDGYLPAKARSRTTAMPPVRRRVHPVTDNEHNLSFDLAVEGPEAVITVNGELDPHTADTLADALRDLTAREDLRSVVLDLSDVSFIDSSGLRAILTAHDELRNREAQLTLRSPSEAVHRLLEITDLLGHLDVR